MNPEFQRNLWLDLSVVRLFTMPFVLGLIFVAVWTTAGLGDSTQAQLLSLSETARVLFFIIVVCWGSWTSARLVTGEIRDRTWDAQRMSAIGPWTMVWGKLLGGTAYIWYGGLICLLPIVALEATKGLGNVLENLLFYISMGLFAHATSFFVSMLMVRRKATSSRIASFFAFAAGIAAAGSVQSLWIDMPWPADLPYSWFGIGFDYFTFQLGSLALFVLWVVLGCYVLMRQELQIITRPWAWIGFVIYSMVLAAGQMDVFALLGDFVTDADAAAKMANETGLVQGLPEDTMLLLRWTAAGFIAITLTYLSLFVAPKDWVQLRWARSQLFKGRMVSAILDLPSWFYAYVAVCVAAAFIVTQLNAINLTDTNEIAAALAVSADGLPTSFDPRPVALAIVLFIARDIGIVLWFNAGRSAKRPDFAAYVVLVVLYVLVPLILLGMQGRATLPFFTWWPGTQGWMHPVWPALQAGAVFVLIAARRGMVRSAG